MTAKTSKKTTVATKKAQVSRNVSNETSADMTKRAALKAKKDERRRFEFLMQFGYRDITEEMAIKFEESPASDKQIEKLVEYQISFQDGITMLNAANLLQEYQDSLPIEENQGLINTLRLWGYEYEDLAGETVGFCRALLKDEIAAAKKQRNGK